MDQLVGGWDPDDFCDPEDDFGLAKNIGAKVSIKPQRPQGQWRQPHLRGGFNAAPFAAGPFDTPQDYDPGDDPGDGQDDGQDDGQNPDAESEFEGESAPHTVQQLLRRRSTTARRSVLLHLNHDSPLSIERYTMAITSKPFIVSSIFASTGATLLSGTQNPDCEFHPQRFTSNAPSPGFVTLSMAKVANVNIVVGGAIDVWQWNAQARDQTLDVPTLTPANSASFAGGYTGLATSAVLGAGGGMFTFILSASGPAKMTGLYNEDELVTEPT